MANLRYCSFCGALTTTHGSCDCQITPTPAESPRAERQQAQATTRRSRDRGQDYKTAYKVMGIGFAAILIVVAVCSWMVDRSPENRSASEETLNIAAIQQMDIRLSDCYRWLLQYDDSKQARLAQGYQESAAEEIAVEVNRRDHTFSEYLAILQRCGTLWEFATEQEQRIAMRDSGVH